MKQPAPQHYSPPLRHSDESAWPTVAPGMGVWGSRAAALVIECRRREASPAQPDPRRGYPNFAAMAYDGNLIGLDVYAGWCGISTPRSSATSANVNSSLSHGFT